MAEKVTLRLRLEDAEFEATGSETFVHSVWKEFFSKFGGSGVSSGKPSISPPKSSMSKSAKKPAPKAKARNSKKTPAYHKNDEFANGEMGAKFISEWEKINQKPKGAVKTNIVFMYLLKEKLQYSPVDSNLLYTCYKVLSL
ncbi:MAG: hypothetical protein GDA55_07830 [Cellvibrionales bacterium]|nr:hypothetical protein [Cellvibrionales bacterium]